MRKDEALKIAEDAMEAEIEKIRKLEPDLPEKIIGELIMENNFYVYMYLREDGTPYYVGKGKDKRAWSKHTNVQLPSDKKRIIIHKSNLSEIDALDEEFKLVLKYGRKDIKTGILHNKTNGGERGSLKPGTIKWINNETQSRRIGKYDSTPEGWKEGRIYHFQEKMIYINDGKENKLIPQGKKIPKGFVVGRKSSSTKDKIYINDGFKDRFIPKTDPIPEGWKIGRAYRNNEERLKKLSAANKLNHCITNGKENRVIKKTDPIPEDWKIGKIFSELGLKNIKDTLSNPERMKKVLETKRKNGTMSPSPEATQKMVATRMQRNNYKHTEETKRKIAEANKARVSERKKLKLEEISKSA